MNLIKLRYSKAEFTYPYLVWHNCIQYNNFVCKYINFSFLAKSVGLYQFFLCLFVEQRKPMHMEAFAQV